jgi:hypothetical protein
MTTPSEPPPSPDATTEWPARRRANDPPADSPAAVRLAVALLRDQAERWRAGHRRPVEGYLDAHPELAEYPSVASLLAANEFRLRAGRGEAPKLDEYRRRFPRWAARLELDLAFLQQLEPGGPAAPHPDGPPPRNAAVVPTRTLAEQLERRSWPRIPRYEIAAELGRGGMAVVYRARQADLQRSVALKVILAGALAGPAERTRMRREAEAVARVRHPNVVQIFDTGEHDGCLYLALEYVSGGSLDRRLRSHPLPPAEAARIVEQLAAGVQAAHDAGIVHRDLKPANVLLDPDGTPKVTDFGLAKLHDAAVRLTLTGTTAGTPCYMSPEQVNSDPDRIGPATDIYGLGGILYECLTGRPPFDAPTTLETIRQVAEEEVVPVCRLQASVPRDLETICLKCLRKDSRQRYPTARELADDLARFRAGEPILARPVGVAEQAWRWVRRHPVVPLMALTLGLMVATVVGLMAWTTYHAYQVAGHLRERELHLHGLRGTLLRLDESQTRYAELAAATGDPHWEGRFREVAAEAERHRAEAARLAPDVAAAVGLLPASDEVRVSEHRALEAVRAGRTPDAWGRLQGPDHRAARDAYTTAVNRFADRVDAAADAELRQVRAEGFWSLLSAAAVAGLIGLAALAAWFLCLRDDRRLSGPRRTSGSSVVLAPTHLLGPNRPSP